MQRQYWRNPHVEAALLQNWVLSVYSNNVAAKKLYFKMGMIRSTVKETQLYLDSDEELPWILHGDENECKKLTTKMSETNQKSPKTFFLLGDVYF